MRRIGVHRVFVPARAQLLSFQVVTVGDGGEVAGWTSLSHEQAATEWWGGLLVVAPGAVERLPGETFDTFCRRLAGHYAPVAEGAGPLQAYRVAPFDVVSLEFTPDSRLYPIG